MSAYPYHTEELILFDLNQLTWYLQQLHPNKWRELPSIADELKQDNEFYYLLSRELEKFYDKAMKLTWQQIEVANGC